MKRTTVSIEEDDYIVLEREAERRGVPVGHLIREAAAAYVAEIRTTRRPHFGVAKGHPGLSQESVDDEVSPILERARRHGWL